MNRGLEHDIAELVASVETEAVLGPLFSDASAVCKAVRRHAEALDDLDGQLERLRDRLGRVEEFGVAAWRRVEGRGAFEGDLGGGPGGPRRRGRAS